MALVSRRGTAVRLLLTPMEGAHLLNLVSDNPRVWNREIREGLGEAISPTEAHNAAVELRTGPKEAS